MNTLCEQFLSCSCFTVDLTEESVLATCLHWLMTVRIGELTKIMSSKVSCGQDTFRFVIAGSIMEQFFPQVNDLFVEVIDGAPVFHNIKRA